MKGAQVCSRCGREKASWGSAVYFPCKICNDEFWQKWYQLPKVIMDDQGEFIHLPAHIELIKEYQKEGYFSKPKTGDYAKWNKRMLK